MGSRPRPNEFPEPSRSRRRGDEACDQPGSEITCGSNETVPGHARSTAPPMKLEYTVQIWREDNQFIARAWPIDVASSGETPEAARLAVDEAVANFILAASDQGTLHRNMGSVPAIGKLAMPPRSEAVLRKTWREG